MRSKAFIIPLDGVTDRDQAIVGVKAVGLARLRRMGMSVPDAFCIITNAYKTHISSPYISPVLKDALVLLSNPGNLEVDKILSKIRRAITDSPLASSLAAEIESQYRLLSADHVAVRSSGTAEDLPGHSFAGLYDTYLGIETFEACLTAVKKCWASLWTERAYSYRQKNSFDHSKVEMAVIVQVLVPAEVSGVVFTADPVTGDGSRIIVESCRGLGEALVSGKVTPDRFVIDGVNCGIISKELSQEPCISEPTVEEIVKLAKKVQSQFRCPQDIEWAVHQNEVFLLQSRPVTTTRKAKTWEERQVWTNANFGEVAPDVMTPITESMIRKVLHPLLNSIWRILTVNPGDNPIGDLVAGRLYWNVNTLIGTIKHLPHWWKVDFDTTMGGLQGQMFELGQIDLSELDIPDLGGRLAKVILRLPVSVYEIFTHRYNKAHQAVEDIRRKGEELGKMDISKMSEEELARRVPVAIDETFGTLDLLYVMTSLPAVAILYKVCERWLDDDNGKLTSRLLSGLAGMDHAEAGLALWTLALKARQTREIEKLILCPGPWPEVRGKLEGVEGGKIFLNAWDDFIFRHGHHCRGELELFNSRWSENPDYIFELVRNYLGSADGRNPVSRHSRLIEERQQLAQKCSARLRNPIKRWIFNYYLRKSWQASVLRENSKSYVVRCVAVFRKMLLELGRRWANDGVLDNPEDIFFLKLEELEPALKRAGDFDIRGIVAMRHADYDKWRSVTPPSVIVGKFDPDKYKQKEEVYADTDVLKGVAASSGVVTGKARVILRSDEDEQVKAGEILVAPFTDPGWTPYFIPAAGIVMDMGGLLSHGSVIAREYGIPAVVNVGRATKVIKTGQKIEVDGDRGIVRILK